MGLLKRTARLQLPVPTGVVLPDGRVTVKRADEIRRLIIEARSLADRASVPREAVPVVDFLTTMVQETESSLSDRERSPEDVGEGPLKAAFEDCLRLGVAVAQVEERHLSPRPGRIDHLGSTVLAFVALRETKTKEVPSSYQIFGNYLVHLGHYLTRAKEPPTPEILVGSMGKSGAAVAANERYRVMVEATDEVWARNVGSA